MKNKDSHLTQSELEKIFVYSEKSPSGLKYANKEAEPKNRKPHEIKDWAGWFDKASQYFIVKYKNTDYPAHRIIMILAGHNLEGKCIDHINGIKTDNRIENLRVATPHINRLNQVKRINNVSGYTGVSYHKNSKCWVARWTDSDRKEQCKAFSVKKFGNDEAKKLAANFRRQKILELRENGHEYTERHGL